MPLRHMQHGFPSSRRQACGAIVGEASASDLRQLHAHKDSIVANYDSGIALVTKSSIGMNTSRAEKSEDSRPPGHLPQRFLRHADYFVRAARVVRFHS